MHPDFERILKMFRERYGEEEGERRFLEWIKRMGLDPEKSYTMPIESFNWAKRSTILSAAKEDEEAKYYRVEALFPVKSMNNWLYTEDELIRAARTLIGKPVNINHETPIEGVEVVDAEFEDGAVECIIKVHRDASWNGKSIIDLIDSGEISHVSIEGRFRSAEPVDGLKPEGLILTGLALLTRENLPGIPLTRIMPIEKIIEQELCYLCSRPLSDAVLLGEYRVHPECARRFWEIASQVFQFAEKRSMRELGERAVASHETEKAPEETPWNADEAEARIRRWASTDGSGEKEKIDWSRYREAYAWYNEEAPEEFGSYKLPHHDIINGRLVVVWRGVAAAMAALAGARGGVDIPAEDRRAVYNHLARHYRQFEREPPELTEILIACLESKIEMLRKTIQEQAEKHREHADRKESSEANKETELTKEALIKRFKDLRSQGYSQRDAWRLVALETIEMACGQEERKPEPKF